MRNPLNDADIDGNTLNLNQEEGELVEDSFFCRTCSSIVPERNWNPVLKCCNECADEVTNYGAF